MSSDGTGKENKRWFFIGLATSKYDPSLDIEDRPELLDVVQRMRALFTDELKFEAPEFSSNASADELRRNLSRFLTAKERSPNDTVVFYYTGHGVIAAGDRFFLPFPETTDDLWRSALNSESLAQWLLRGTVVRRFMIIIDTCHAGASTTALTTEHLLEIAATAGTEQVPSVAAIAAARPLESAESQAFANAFIEAVRHESIGRHEPEFLPVDSILKRVKTRLPQWQSVVWTFAGAPDAVGQYLPNPRQSLQGRDLDLRSRDMAQDALRREELKSHVWPRAQGLDVPMDGRYLFTGRTAAMTGLCRWLSSDAVESLIVTGGPGSGKSALLARLYVLSDRILRKRIPNLNDIPNGSMPPDGGIRRFVHARGKTTAEVLAALNEAAGATAETVADLMSTLRRRDASTLTIIVDAVDEATDADALVHDILAPVIRNGPMCHIRLLIGTRDHLLNDLGGHFINIDAPAYADPQSVRAYARRCLAELVPNSPYQNAPTVADRVAEAVGEAAGKSFLVALITARSLALRSTVVSNPEDSMWRSRLPREAAAAMERDMEERLLTMAGKARDLLVPLAYAEGAGLPWEDIWASVASHVSGRPYGDPDIEWLIRNAGYYIIEGQESGRSSYRLYHQALSEHLRKATDADQADRLQYVQTKFLHALHATVDGQAWSQAHPYVRRHLASHAAHAGLVDGYFTDPAYLIVADRTRLLAAAARCRTEEGRRAALAFQQSTSVGIESPGLRLAYLGMAARQYGADVLAARVAESRAALWQTPWARWSPAPPHRVISRLADPVQNLGVVVVNGVPTIMAAIGADLQCWTLESGRKAGEVTVPGPGRVVPPSQPQDGSPSFYFTDDELYAVDIDGEQVQVRLLDRQRRALSASAACRVGEQDCVAFAVNGERRGVRLVRSDGRRARPDLDLAHLAREHLEGTNVAQVRHLTRLWAPGGDLIVTSDPQGWVYVWDPLKGALKCWWAHTNTVLEFLIGCVVDGKSAVVAIGHRSQRPTSEGANISEALRDVRARTDDELRNAENKLTQNVQVWFPSLRNGKEDVISYQISEQATALAVEAVEGRPLLITGSIDGGIRIRDLRTGSTEYESPRGHAGAVTSIAAYQSQARSVIVSGGEDGTVRVWDLGPQLSSRDLGAGLYSARAVGIVGHGTTKMIAAGTEDRPGHRARRHTLMVHGGASGTADMTLHEPGAPIAILAALEHNTEQRILTTAHQDCMVYVWTPNSGLTTKWMAHERPITAITASVLADTMIAFTGSADGTVVAWDIERLRLSHTMWQGRGDVPTALAVWETPGLTALVIGTERGRLVLLNARHGQAIAPVLDLNQRIRSIAVDNVRSMALVTTESGCIAVSFDGPGTGPTWPRGWAACSVPTPEVKVSIAAVACSRKRGLWAIASGDRLVIGDSRRGVVGEIDVWSAIRSVAVADDGTIALAAQDGLLELRVGNLDDWPHISDDLQALSDHLKVVGSLLPETTDHATELGWEPDRVTARTRAARKLPNDYYATDDMWTETPYDAMTGAALIVRTTWGVLLSVALLVVAATVALVISQQPPAEPAGDLVLNSQIFCSPTSPLFAPAAPICLLRGTGT